jgi:hypothetical protein
LHLRDVLPPWALERQPYDAGHRLHTKCSLHIACCALLAAADDDDDVT